MFDDVTDMVKELFLLPEDLDEWITLDETKDLHLCFDEHGQLTCTIYMVVEGQTTDVPLYYGTLQQGLERLN